MNANFNQNIIAPQVFYRICLLDKVMERKSNEHKLTQNEKSEEIEIFIETLSRLGADIGFDFDCDYTNKKKAEKSQPERNHEGRCKSTKVQELKKVKKLIVLI